MLARLGGDEFVVLVDDMDAAGGDGARRPGCAVSSSGRSSSAGMGLTIDASIGIALGPEHSATAEELLQLADLAMYSAKAGRQRRRGLRRASGDGDGRAPARGRSSSCARGIAAGELVLHYQPKLEPRDGRGRRRRGAGPLAAPGPRTALPRRLHRRWPSGRPDGPADLHRRRDGAGPVPRAGPTQGRPLDRLGERQPLQPGRRGLPRARSPLLLAPHGMPAARAGARGDREHPHGGPGARRAGAGPAAATPASASPSTTTAPATPAWPTSPRCRSPS